MAVGAAAQGTRAERSAAQLNASAPTPWPTELAPIMMPTSGAVMCHSGTRIGRTKAVDSALNASKNVALPMTTRARTNQPDIGNCSMRASKLAAASSEANGCAGDGTAEAPDKGSAWATDKGSLPFVYRPALSACTNSAQASPRAGWRVGSDIARPLDQRQNFLRDRRRALARRQMAHVRQDRQCRVRQGFLDLLGHRDRGRVILFADDDAGWHPLGRLIVPKIGIAQHLAGRGVAVDIVGEEHSQIRADQLRMRLAERIAHPA